MESRKINNSYYYSPYSQNQNYAYIASQVYGNYANISDEEKKTTDTKSNNKFFQYLKKNFSFLNNNFKKFINWLDN